MDIKLASKYKNKKEFQIAEEIIRRCVHCGFCNSTCPTYQILGDERDSPRGRISIIKDILEGSEPTIQSQIHLDRCLLCRNCETTCPSGVEYGTLYKIGNKVVEKNIKTKSNQKFFRFILREFLLSKFFYIGMYVSKKIRFILPKKIKKFIPKSKLSFFQINNDFHRSKNKSEKKIILFLGCVQKSMLPSINEATQKILKVCDYSYSAIDNNDCCGAIRSHLSDNEGQIKNVKRNIDLWWPEISDGNIKYIISNASACSLEIKNYGKVLSDDPKYSEKAKKVSKLAIDLSEILPEIVNVLASKINFNKKNQKLVFHPPCTLQHGHKINGLVERNLEKLGYKILKTNEESNLCCGSAGTYSLFHPEISIALKKRKIDHIKKLDCDLVISANVGCISHLQSESPKSVKHWVEVLADDLKD